MRVGDTRVGEDGLCTFRDDVLWADDRAAVARRLLKVPRTGSSVRERLVRAVLDVAREAAGGTSPLTEGLRSSLLMVPGGAVGIREIPRRLKVSAAAKSSLGRRAGKQKSSAS